MKHPHAVHGARFAHKVLGHVKALWRKQAAITVKIHRFQKQKHAAHALMEKELSR